RPILILAAISAAVAGLIGPEPVGSISMQVFQVSGVGFLLLVAPSVPCHSGSAVSPVALTSWNTGLVSIPRIGNSLMARLAPVVAAGQAGLSLFRLAAWLYAKVAPPGPGCGATMKL